MPVDETLLRLIAWVGGEAAAANWLLGAISCGGGDDFDGTSDEAFDHVRELADTLEEWINEEWPRDQDAHCRAVADACRSYGY
jgi:hypothetical protein